MMKPELIEALNFFQVTVQTFDPRTAHLQVELLVLLSSSLIICLCLDPWVLEEEDGRRGCGQEGDRSAVHLGFTVKFSAGESLSKGSKRFRRVFPQLCGLGL